MTLECLNYCFTLHSHHQKTDSLDLKELLKSLFKGMNKDKHFLAIKLTN